MEFRDFIITPIVIMVVYMVVYFIRPFATDATSRRYFFPALTLKIIGAIALGIIYQFYYDGGDTFNYHSHGSRIIWNAFNDDLIIGTKLLFSNGGFIPRAYKYMGEMYFYNDPSSYTIIRIATIFDLLTYSSYSATAVFFSLISFSGGWALFNTFYKKYPHLHLQIALAALFVPSVIFWGSGILKDTIVLAALGFAVYCIDKIFIEHQVKFITLVVLLVSLYLIVSIRKFVLQAFIPSAILWVYYKHFISLKSIGLKILIAPMIVLIFVLTAYYTVIKIGEGDAKYSIDKLAKTAQVTAYDIRYWTGKDAGSGYSLGALDGSFSSMVLLAPQAINVSLFRPYIWEVKSPLMVLSALEGTFFFLFTLYAITLKKVGKINFFSDPNVIFCFVFSIVFAFATGISTFNFGTLARYKIPLLPFYLIGLILITSNSHRQGSELDSKNK